MKKSVFLILIWFVLSLMGSPIFAQETTAKKDIKFTVKTNPLSAMGGPLYVLWIVPITAEYKVYFEAKTLGNQSVQVGLGYLGSSPLVASMGDLGGDTTIGSSGIHAQLWYKFFLTGDKAPAGFYIGPHISYATAKLKNNKVPSEYFSASKLNINVAFGYQIITKGGFALDIFTGIGLKNKKFDTSNSETNQTFRDWKLNNKTSIGVPLGFSFGYAF
jgi:hypothetical protein